MSEQHVEYRIARKLWPGAWSPVQGPVMVHQLKKLKEDLERYRELHPDEEYCVQQRLVTTEPWDLVPGSEK